MRLSEKTLELNICSQLANFPRYPRSTSRRPLLWFGLTQAQEARAGFDAWTRIGGRLFILQFKASDKDVAGVRRFVLPHPQLAALRKQLRGQRRCVFYVFPLVGTTYELTRSPRIIRHTWLLDVSQLAHIAPPTKADGALRKSQLHYVDIRPGTAIIHSQPSQVQLIGLDDLVDRAFSGGYGFGKEFHSFDRFWSIRRHLSKNSGALVVPSR
jgi:hypothetical protein